MINRALQNRVPSVIAELLIDLSVEFFILLLFLLPRLPSFLFRNWNFEAEKPE